MAPYPTIVLVRLEYGHDPSHFVPVRINEVEVGIAAEDASNAEKFDLYRRLLTCLPARRLRWGLSGIYRSRRKRPPAINMANEKHLICSVADQTGD